MLDLVLRHESTVTEDGQRRQVSLEIKAIGIGAVTQPLARWALGEPAQLAGFLAATRNGRGLLFHITEIT